MPLVLLRLLYRARKAPAYVGAGHERFAVGGDSCARGVFWDSLRYRVGEAMRLRRWCGIDATLPRLAVTIQVA